MHFARDLREDGGGVAGTGADFQDVAVAVQFQGLGHQGHNVRLRDGLLLGNSQRGIAVGQRGHLGGYEFFAGHLVKGGQHGRVADAARDQMLFEHGLAGLGKFVHHGKLTFCSQIAVPLPVGRSLGWLV